MVIENEADLKQVLDRLADIFHAEEGTVQADERQAIATAIEAYERELPR